MKYFEGIEKVKYEGADSKNPLAYHYYDQDKIVLGKPMKEHLKFAIAYWHTMDQEGADPFGVGTAKRNWYGETPMETAKNRVDAFFELLQLLDVKYFCFHDVDIAPEGDSLEEFYQNLDEITDLIKEKMDKTGIKLLWNTANMFTNPRYLNGAATTNNADVYAYAAAQVKKGLDISKKLGGENYVFWGGREGYEELFNTDYELEQENLAKFFHMACDYSDKIGHKVQFLIEPKPREPMRHQYDYDAATALFFINKYGLKDRFKLNLEGNHATLAGHTFEHELRVARTEGALGSIDANHSEEQLGWDTDEFPYDLYHTSLAMYEILENDGLGKGGINFDAKVRRTSIDQEDLLTAHISGMDTFARGLLAAAKMKEDGFIDEILDKKYESYKSGLGKDIVDGKMDLESLTEYALKNDKIENKSSHLEYLKARINDYLV